MQEIPDAQQQRLQCGGGTMHVYRGARLFEVGGVLICSWCLKDVRDDLQENAPLVDQIVFSDELRNVAQSKGRE